MVHTPASARWSAIIDKQEASGQTIRAFAADHDLNPSTLAWWRSRLGRGARRSPAPPPPTAFTELVVVDAQLRTREHRVVVIALERVGAHVLVDNDTDLSLLRQVVDALC